MTVLVIDDEEDIRLIAKVALETSGMTVLTAAGGEDGFLLARRQRPDLIVLDIMMPVMDGYATLDAIQRDPATARIPVVMLTGKSLAADDDALRSRGVVALITKPFRPRAFAADVRAAIASARAT